MDIQQIISMIENKIISYKTMQNRFIEDGNMEAVASIENDILATQDTLSKLQTLVNG